mgnify:CR=1 FL=1
MHPFVARRRPDKLPGLFAPPPYFPRALDASLASRAPLASFACLSQKGALWKVAVASDLGFGIRRHRLAPTSVLV